MVYNLCMRIHTYGSYREIKTGVPSSTKMWRPNGKVWSPEMKKTWSPKFGV